MIAVVFKMPTKRTSASRKPASFNSIVPNTPQTGHACHVGAQALQVVEQPIPLAGSPHRPSQCMALTSRV